MIQSGNRSGDSRMIEDRGHALHVVLPVASYSIRPSGKWGIA